MSNQPKPKSRGKRNANRGPVYVLSNPFYWVPEKEDSDALVQPYKIGSAIGTRAALNGRMRQLYTTGVITPFVAEYAKIVENPKEVEKQIHKVFDDARVNPKREFFKVKLPAIIAALEPYSGDVIPLDEDEYTSPKEAASDDVEIDEDSLGKPRKKGTDWVGLYQIPVGSTLTFNGDESITAKTTACGKVIYEGEIVTFHNLTKRLIRKYKLTLTSGSADAKTYWRFEGMSLHHRRLKIRRGEL